MYGRGPPGYPPSGPSGYRDAPPHGYGGGGGGPGGSYQGVPTGPRTHAGLGAPGAPSSLPRPPNLPPAPAFGGGSPAGGGAAVGPGMGMGEKFSLFVGSIAEGVENGWLERILGVAGPVLSFRRPSPPFAFVEYSDPESVLRCLEVVNGAKIMGKNKEEKALLVKADEKTRARLDEYEQGRTNSDLTQQARGDLSAILVRIAAGDSLSAAPVAPPTTSSNPSVHIPNHLKDLAPEDLPENQRENTLSSIALFRERAMKKAQEKKELERQIEERRKAMIANKVQQRPTPTPPAGATMGEQAGSPDPQSFNKPMSFVQAGPSSGSPAAPQPEPEIDDARRERERAEREHRQAEAVFRDRERRYEQRERARIAAWERERVRERGVAEQEDHDRSFMAERLATWDDDREAERGRESFYTDRIRWRAQRKPFRMREQEADARDRALEAQHLAAVAEQSNSFLSQHADLFASALQQPGTPNAVPSAAATNGATPAPEGETSTSTPAPGVKLSFGAAAAKPKQAEPPVKRPAVLGMAEDDEEGRRKRELIPLSYSDDEDGAKPKARLSRREAEEKTRELEGRVPSDKDGLWGWKVRWKSLNEDIIKRKMAPFANQCIVEYLGGEEAELLNAVTEHLRAHKPAQELVEELEPVLDEEANDLVVKVWRVLVLETELAHAGVSL
ncbi:hypothetical protein JCM1841_006822 [Sporobolomyces salmonicolor]